ncbi:hypothetical protein [Thiolapillus sp.]|uniref:hypothetical protein n=1 Tax=Thiolapillus sp. TaxID=2017437 RepID=UPI003AF61617
MPDNGQEGAAVWAASALVFDPMFREQRCLSRKTDVAKIAEHRRNGYLPIQGDKLDTASGPWKGYSLFESLVGVNQIRAWCIGDKFRVETLLSRITHIGKRRCRGYGEIEHIEVTPDPAAQDMVFWRVLGWPRDGYAKTQCGIRPPYWKPAIGYYPKRIVLDTIADCRY